MKDITHIFFDLDHTLWDYEVNARDTLIELYETFELNSYFSSFRAFHSSFQFHNDKLWYRYNRGQINRAYIRERRFYQILEARVPITSAKALEMSDFFTSRCPGKTALVPGTEELLDYVDGRYELGILTNGFDDIQAKKLSNTNLDQYFNWIITSETTQYRKPSKEIFDHALTLSGAQAIETLMVGDNLKVDIQGADQAGWRSVWFNPENSPEKHPDIRVTSLKELLELL
ncbi:MAG: YjjG family noncanonical pyrimidine nucleotidase [Cyclobacteriaceae bacterium]|nr:YjjG family noncanonical pyrimidine nucleotidase [Cyclobacteriaceae bacterium HetDA_MAG_MS6]